ncbi:MAG: hypothetical protein IT204_21995 [Fimbriimonadaceae bacterium]|nr:hypothetical protein [Fimbriimonadaceae bacterium]
MRGYLTRPGLGMLIAIGLLALLGAWCQPGHPGRLLRATTPEVATVGPFEVQIERYQVDPATQRAYLQLHLYRPHGPVPLAERIDVSGRPRLRGGLLVDRTVLIRNELERFPQGAAWQHPVLGRVPATRHAGEIRAVFEFVLVSRQFQLRDDPQSARAAFEFELPDGRTASFHALPETR